MCSLKFIDDPTKSLTPSPPPLRGRKIRKNHRFYSPSVTSKAQNPGACAFFQIQIYTQKETAPLPSKATCFFPRARWRAREQMRFEHVVGVATEGEIASFQGKRSGVLAASPCTLTPHPTCWGPQSDRGPGGTDSLRSSRSRTGRNRKLMREGGALQAAIRPRGKLRISRTCESP